jgi:hypothetical protein
VDVNLSEPQEIYNFPWRGRLYKDGRVDWYECDPDFGDPDRVMPEAMRHREK